VVAERFAEFHAQRDELRAYYGRLAEASGRCAETESLVTGLLLGLIESVILIRRTSVTLDAASMAGEVADGALRLLWLHGAKSRHGPARCGLPQRQPRSPYGIVDSMINWYRDRRGQGRRRTRRRNHGV